MTLQQIKAAVESGKLVFWKNKGYRVVHTENDQWFIACGAHRIGLTCADEVTLNGNEADFFCEAISLAIGQVVQFAHPLTDDEKVERFLVLELRGDRVLVEFICDWLVRPTFSYLESDLVVEAVQ